MRSIGHFIGGKEVKGTSGRTADVFEPMTGDLQATVAPASKAEAGDAAIGQLGRQAATRGFAFGQLGHGASVALRPRRDGQVNVSSNAPLHRRKTDQFAVERFKNAGHAGFPIELVEIEVGYVG